MEQVSASAPTILMVEDEPLVRFIGTHVLTDAGFRVIEANNAEQALRVLEKGADVRLVFTDIEMPGVLNGLGLARCVHERWPWISVLVTSGSCEKSVNEIEMQSWFVPKPYAPATLLNKIEACLSGAASAAA